MLFNTEFGWTDSKRMSPQPVFALECCYQFHCSADLLHLPPNRAREREMDYGREHRGIQTQ